AIWSSTVAGCLQCRDIGRRRGSLWARHAHADIADVQNVGQLATGELGGGVVLASQRVKAVMGRRTWVRRPWVKASRGGGSVERWVASRQLDGVHMMNDLDLQMEGSLVTETNIEAFEEKWMVRWAREENMAWFRSEMGDDRSGMKMNSLITGEEDLPRVATVINVGLRPRRIWNVLVVSVVMSGLDRGDDGLVVMGFDGEKAMSLSSSSPSTVRRCMAGGDG
ncbi:hypothetical protein ACLOJK_004594, partial [Asimina triloba]